jgi:hypothetical protein
MNACFRAILICSLSVFASVLTPLNGAAQPVYSVMDLGKAPEPVIPEPYNFSNGGGIEFMAGNPSGQIIISRFIPGNIGAFFWEPGLTAPIRIGISDDSVNAAGISGNGYVVGTNSGGFQTPYIWSRATGRVVLQGGIDNLYPLAVNTSALVVGFDSGTSPQRAVLWNQERERIYLDELPITGKGPWTGFEQARTISDAGSITGIGRFISSGGVVEPHYFALVPVASSDGALNRSDWVASATESAPGDPPAHAIDGDLNTRFSTGKAQHDSQGFQVSWPADRIVGRIRFEVGPSTGDYPTTCGIWVTDTSANVTFINCMADGSGNVDVSFTPIPVQKIEVWQWGSAPAWWSIAEFNAYSN